MQSGVLNNLINMATTVQSNAQHSPLKYVSDATLVSFEATCGRVFLVPIQEGVQDHTHSKKRVSANGEAAEGGGGGSVTSPANPKDSSSDPNGASGASQIFHDSSSSPAAASLGLRSPILEWSPERRAFVQSSREELERAGRQRDAQGRSHPPTTEHCHGVFGTYDVGPATFIILITEVAVAATGVPQYGTLFRITGLRLRELVSAAHATSPSMKPSSGSLPLGLGGGVAAPTPKRDHLDEVTIARYRETLARFCNVNDPAGGSCLYTSYDANAVLRLSSSSSSTLLSGAPSSAYVGGFDGGDAMQRSPIFRWNGWVCTRSFEKYPSFVPPVFRGYVGTEVVRRAEAAIASLGNDAGTKAPCGSVRVALICRLSVRRAGTRYNRRGIDHNGYVANFSETEQIVWCGNRVASFVSVRGSVPVGWTQQADLRIVPRIHMPGESDPDDIGRHMRILSRLYDRPSSTTSTRYIFLNLLGAHKHERRLTQRFASTMDADNEEARKVGAKSDDARVQYVPFDLNAALRTLHKKEKYSKMHVFDAVSLELLTAMQEFFPRKTCDLSVNSWELCCATNASPIAVGQMLTQQDCMLRINCLDCLDRSNIAQCIVNIRALGRQLTAVLGDDAEARSLEPQVANALRNLWIAHGDELSQLYTGTPAHGAAILGSVKGDAGGKEEFKKASHWLGIGTSLRRWLHNNFFDGPKQDVVTLISGDHAPSARQVERPVHKGITFNMIAVGVSYAVCFLAILVNTILYIIDGLDLRSWLVIAAGWWFALLILVILTIQKGGRVVAVSPILHANRQYY